MASSERPRTPPRSVLYSHDDGAEQRTTYTEVQTDAFTPNFLDLVYAINDSTHAIGRAIPSTYYESEAVDSSIALGEGASFTASLQRISHGPKWKEVVVDAPGWSITSSKSASNRPKLVVYKTARIAFDDEGQPLPQYRRAMQSVLTEFHALVYPPLRKHPNIINYLGFAWGTNPFNPDHRLPALIVEYAEHGTLADFLEKQRDLPSTTKSLLCHDVASGLAALHDTGLVHGDVKAENVLICAHDTRTYVAKIADFGFSVVQMTERDSLWMGGTRPWMAPEVMRGSVLIDLAPKTDIFSFGLLCWVVSLDGGKPWEYLSLATSKQSLGISEFEQFKENDELLNMAVKEEWLSRHAHKKFDGLIEEALSMSMKALKVQPKEGFDLDLLQKHQATLRSETFKYRLGKLKMESFWQQLPQIFRLSLSTDPAKRDLRAIIALFETEPKESANLPAAHKIGSTSLNPSEAKASSEVPQYPAWTRRGFKYHWLSWSNVLRLDPSIQTLAYRSLLKESGPDIFLRCALHVNGYGCAIDFTKALQFVQQAADLGHDVSKAFMYRIHATLGKPGDPVPGAEHLFEFAAHGSRAALETLETVDPEKYDHAVRWNRLVCGGVGASWLYTSDLLHGHTKEQWLDEDWCMPQIANCPSPGELIINRRGDTVFNFAAMTGKWKILQSLVVDYHIDINLRNAQGETPLLSACRAGQCTPTILCLQRYNADASLVAKNGETPLHWLISFEDGTVEPLINDLIAHGAEIDACTQERVAHSMFLATIDVDFLPANTPLGWAAQRNRPVIVKALLEAGAEPRYENELVAKSPFHTAAYFHNYECLAVMIEHLESKVTHMRSDGQPELRAAVMYGPTIQQAMHGSDKFSMVLRHGASHLENFRATFDLLREKTKYMTFDGCFHGSPLYYAVSYALDEVVRYMFQHQWCTNAIDRPIGEARRTAFLEAVRWNRVHIARLLLANGADVKACAANPFQPSKTDWTALHVFAHEGHNEDLEMVSLLTQAGVSIEGSQGQSGSYVGSGNLLPDVSSLSLQPKANVYDTETPFTLALRRNSFNLCTSLLSHDADPNALTYSSGLFTSLNPLTPLGHLIISNARYSAARLTYLLDQKPSFIVEPERQLTALHRAVLEWRDVTHASTGVDVKEEEFDRDTNLEILELLLRRFKESQEVDARCGVNGDTALHLAVETGNIKAVETLLRAGASQESMNQEAETPLEVALKLQEGKEGKEREVRDEIIELLAS